MRNKKQLVASYGLLLSAIFFFYGCSGPVAEWRVSAPTGGLSIRVFSEVPGQPSKLFYEVQLADQAGQPARTLLLASPLGFSAPETEGANFYEALTFVEAYPVTEGKEAFTAVSGKKREVSGHYREQGLKFRNGAGKTMELWLRAYPDGVAFRYRFPEGAPAFSQEHTGFTLPEGGMQWLQPYDTVTKWTPGYERPYLAEIAIGTPSPRPEGWCFPVLTEHPDGAWSLITEAGLDGNWAGTHLEPVAVPYQAGPAKGFTYTIRYPEAEEAFGAGSRFPLASSVDTGTPWRVIMAGAGLGTIVESDLVKLLAPPSQIADISWIKPGRSSWSWWSDHASSRNPTSMRPFIDLAARMGWEYSLIDANWDTFPTDSLLSLIEYGKSKNVGIWLWYNSGGAHNTVEERPRDLMWDPELRKKEFARLQQWGVKGIKVDFFQSDKQEIIRQYIGILQDAAEYKILVNFHGCTLPRGWERTWPNLLTMESVKGAEAYSFSTPFPEEAPPHNTILPVTRNAVGPMDYTPLTFTDQKYPHLTTYGHELALGVVFETGILHLADRPSGYLSLPEQAQQFLKALPVTWDETRYVFGRPGKEMVIARRKGSTWYIGGINGENREKEVQILLAELPGLSGEVKQLLFADQQARVLGISQTNNNASDSQTVKMAPYGGFVIVAD